jgi:hypothetical protein
MPYKANLGGINGSGVYMPDTRPIVDVGSIIDSASRAFANNREGVLHRALLQQAAQRAERDDALKEEAHRVALISAGFRPATADDEPQTATEPTPGAQPPSPAMNPDGPDAIPADRTTSLVSTPPPMKLGGRGPNADLVYGGMDLKTQRQMALRRNALQAAQAAHPGMFSNEEIELATHDDHAYDALVARREGILKGDQDARDRETSLAGAVGLDGKPLTAATIKMLARSPVAYNKYLDTQINPPKDPVAIHKAERLFDVENPTTSKWVVQATTNGLVQVNPETGEVRPLTDADGNQLQKPVTGQGGANAAKNKALVDLMVQSMPEIERLAPLVRPSLITAAVKQPNLGNIALSPDERQFMAHARNWLAGVMHVESGARLSKEQWDIGLQRFFPTIGDDPATIATKLEAMRRTTADREKEFAAGEAASASETKPPSDNPFAALVPKKK